MQVVGIVLALTCLICGTEAIGIGLGRDVYGHYPPFVLYKILFGKARWQKPIGRADVNFEFGNTTIEELFQKNCLLDCQDHLLDCVDLCIAVQTSCSSDKKDIKYAVQQIKELLGCVGQNCSRYTLVTFSSKAKFSKSKAWYNVDRKLPNIKHGKKCTDCQSNNAKALDSCISLFENINKEDGRDRIPDVIVTITDGVSVGSKYDTPCDKARVDTITKAIEIEGLMDKSLRVIKLPNGVGGTTGDDEWAQLEKTGEQHLDLVEPFTNKSECENVDDIEDLPMIDVAHGPITLNEQDNCLGCCDVDVVLVIDQSISILVDDFDTILNFFREFIEQQQYILEPGNDAPGLRFGIITYCCQIFTRVVLGTQGKDDLMLSLEGIPRTTCTYTATHTALKAAEKMLADYGRVGKRKVVVLATDGRTWECGKRAIAEPGMTIAAADDLKAKEYEIMVLGMPNHKNRNDGFEREWKHVASEPIACTIFNFQVPGGTSEEQGKFSELGLSALHLTRELCTKKKGDPCLL